MGSFLKQPLFFLGWPAQASHWITFHLSTTFPPGPLGFYPRQKPRRHFAPECFFFFSASFMFLFLVFYYLQTLGSHWKLKWPKLWWFWSLPKFFSPHLFGEVSPIRKVVSVSEVSIHQNDPHTQYGVHFLQNHVFFHPMNNGEAEKTNVLLDGWKLQKFEDVKIYLQPMWLVTGG